MYKRIPLLLSVFTLISVITLPALGQVRINEVSHGEVDFMGSTNWVELFNEGDTEANVADLWLCDFPAYPQINSLTVLSGSTTIPAGGYLVLTWTDLDSDSEVGLYSSSSFGDSNALLDYMQYASAGHQREGVAVSAGQWTAGEFVALAATGESLQFFDNGSAGSADWASAPATPGAENAQAAAGGVRINEISHGEVDFMGSTNWVELYNEGDSEIDVA
ncbi:MAG: lamin tail domain-containing protein, partial [Rhodothermaceae bacterium]|nr:lamin tail domain-containing protein [Rhodothermaceae bacterium]